MRKISKPEAKELTAHVVKLRGTLDYLDNLVARAEDYAGDRSETWEESEGGLEHAELRELLDDARTEVEESISAIEQLIPA